MYHIRSLRIIYYLFKPCCCWLPSTSVEIYVFLQAESSEAGWVKDPDDMSKSNSLKALTLMLLKANLANTKWCKNPENDWNPGTWVLIWDYSVLANNNLVIAIQWIPTWQLRWLNQKSLRRMCFGRVNGKNVRPGLYHDHLSYYL